MRIPTSSTSSQSTLSQTVTPAPSPAIEIKKVVPMSEWSMWKDTLLATKASQRVKKEKKQLLLKYGINAINEADGRTLLIEACHTSFTRQGLDAHIGLVSSLLDQKADPNIADNNGKIPLFYALGNNCLPLVRLLIKRGADVNFIPKNDKYNRPQLVEVAGHGCKARLDLLLEYKANPNLKGEIEQVAPLYGAAVNGHPHIVSALLQKGAEVDITTAKGETPLYAATERAIYQSIDGLSSEKYYKAVKILLAAHADPNRQTRYSKTSIIMNLVAHAKKHFNNTINDLVKILSQYKADFDLTDKRGDTPLTYTIKHENIQLTKLLLDCGASINKGVPFETEGSGFKPIVLCSPLILACYTKNDKMVTLLVEKGANKNLMAEDNLQTPLRISCTLRQHQIVKILLRGRKTIDIDAAIVDGSTACHVAAGVGDRYLVELLWENNANINAVMSDGATPLFLAAQEGYTDVVQFLLEKRADSSIARKTGHSPLYIAMHYGHSNVVNLLLRRMKGEITSIAHHILPLVFDRFNVTDAASQAAQTFNLLEPPSSSDIPATTSKAAKKIKYAPPTNGSIYPPEPVQAMSAHAFLKSQGFSTDEIAKLNARKDKSKKDLSVSLPTKGQPEVISWLDGQITSDQDGVKPIDSASIPNCYLWLADRAIHEQGGKAETFENIVTRFCSAFNQEGIKILSRDAEIFVWIQIGEYQRKVQLKHELKIKGDGERVLSFSILSDDGRHTLLVAAIYSKTGLHDEREINALRQRWTREQPLILPLPPTEQMRKTAIMNALKEIGFLSSLKTTNMLRPNPNMKTKSDELEGDRSIKLVLDYLF